VVYHAYPCSPCLYIYRTDAGEFCDFSYPCIQGVGVDEVTGVALEHFASLRAGRMSGQEDTRGGSGEHQEAGLPGGL
jgi:hypothetical protein